MYMLIFAAFISIGAAFFVSVAEKNVDMQLDPGVRMALIVTQICSDGNCSFKTSRVEQEIRHEEEALFG